MDNWKDEYYKLMFSKNPIEINFDKADQVKKINLPKKIYKYQGIDEYSLKNLHNNQLFFRNASDFNDPYDSALTVGDLNYVKLDQVDKMATIYAKATKLPFFEVKNYFTNYPINEAFSMLVSNTPLNITDKDRSLLLAKILYGINKEDERFLESISNMYQKRIYATCFSEIPNSMLMWSHYANNHKGMVLEYDFTELYSKEFLELFLGLHPVHYNDKLLNLNDYENVKEKINLSTLAAISKSNEWLYENEWRILIKQKEYESGIEVPFIKPQRIILGARVNQVHKIFLSVEAKERKIPINQIQLDRSNYKLKISDLEF